MSWVIMKKDGEHRSFADQRVGYRVEVKGRQWKGGENESSPLNAINSYGRMIGAIGERITTAKIHNIESLD